ncbi:MAG: hypothetical protein Q9213_005790 [Squamulea squamosa]
MDVMLEESEMLLGPVETHPNALPSQRTAASEEAAPSDFPSTSPRHGSTGDTRTASSNLNRSASRRRAADPETIQKVEDVVHQIIRSLQQEKDTVYIALRTRKRPATSPSVNLSRSSAHTQYKLSFPGNTPDEAWRFSTPGLTETVCRRTSSMLTRSPAVVLRILELIHEALVSGVVVSKRCASDGATGWFQNLNF